MMSNATSRNRRFPSFLPVGEGEQERFGPQPKLLDLEARRRSLALLPKMVMDQLVEKWRCYCDSDS